MMKKNIEELEQRYKTLQKDFKAGKINETTFVSEIDQLQFQDEWGRYWMVGAQSGAWHYYDGHNWHQSDPRDADKLPIMDAQGLYWQQGIKSGDWYYYDPETEEWIKPDSDEAISPPTKQDVGPVTAGYQPNLEPYTGDEAPVQFDGELFQDDEGRYWAIGAKSGQWYFYDHDGWHPAHEFQPGGGQPFTPQPQDYSAPAPSQPSYQQQQQPTGYNNFQGYSSPPYPQGGQAPYAPPPQQTPGPGYVQPPQPAPSSEAPPSQPTPTPTPAQPSTSESAESPSSDQPPSPPMGQRSESGSWYYFDGEQWLQYASGEPKEDLPKSSPPSKEAASQPSEEGSEASQVKVEPKKEEPVVAEVFEDDDPPEVVDVEVITVIEAEPDDEFEPEESPVYRKRSARAERDSASFASEPTREWTPAIPPDEDEVPPRRRRRPSKPVGVRRASSDEDDRRGDIPRRRRTSDSARSVSPRKREAAHEPTLLIPTDKASSSPSSRRPSKPNRPVSKPVKPSRTPSRPVKVSSARERRARENTTPLEPVSVPRTPTPSIQAHQSSTQTMPAVGREPKKRSRTPSGPTSRPTQPVAPTKKEAEAKTSAEKSKSAPAVAAKERKETGGYTLGDILRSFPGTLVNVVVGVGVLLIFAVVLIAALAMWGNNDLTAGLFGAEPTPTLSAAVSGVTTPTPGPTPTVAPAPLVTPGVPELATFSSADLGFTVGYPEDWENDEKSLLVIFSPSEEGLDPDNLENTAIWFGTSATEGATLTETLADILADFPPDAQTLNEGTISVASKTWTSAQIQYESEDLGGTTIANLAVTSDDGQGYYLVAVAPEDQWALMLPVFQEMINSFRFGVVDIPVAKASVSPEATMDGEDEEETLGTTEATASEDDDEEEDETEATEADSTPEATNTPRPSPTPTAKPTAVTYVVESGDTLLVIARRFGVDIDLLAEENGLDDPESLDVGQELIIPFTEEELLAYNESRGRGSTSQDAADEEEDQAQEEEAEAEDASSSTPAASTPAEDSEAEEEVAATTEASPISGRIAYPAFNPGTDVYDLWMVNLDTEEQTVIAGEASQPAFNKDGSLLAYRSWGLGTRGIHFRDFIGGRGGRVTQFAEDGLPTWSSDNFSFAFATRREGDRVPRIYKGDQQGENDYSIGFQGEYPSVFPDGRIITRGCNLAGSCGLYIIGPLGGGEVKISDDTSDTAPAVSPDGSKIAFMSRNRGGNNWEIWVMNADGSDPKRLTENRSNEGLPTWSPDGNSIAFVSDQGGAWAVWVMNADGSNQRKLFNMKGTPDGNVIRDADNSKGWLEERISWAP